MLLQTNRQKTVHNRMWLINMAFRTVQTTHANEIRLHRMVDFWKICFATAFLGIGSLQDEKPKLLQNNNGKGCKEHAEERWAKVERGGGKKSRKRS